MLLLLYCFVVAVMLAVTCCLLLLLLSVACCRDVRIGNGMVSSSSSHSRSQEHLAQPEAFAEHTTTPSYVAEPMLSDDVRSEIISGPHPHYHHRRGSAGVATSHTHHGHSHSFTGSITSGRVPNYRSVTVGTAGTGPIHSSPTHSGVSVCVWGGGGGGGMCDEGV